MTPIEDNFKRLFTRELEVQKCTTGDGTYVHAPTSDVVNAALTVLKRNLHIEKTEL